MFSIVLGRGPDSVALLQLFPYFWGSSFERLLFSLSWQQKSSLTLLSTANVGSKGSTCNNNSCSGGWPHLGSNRGSRSSIAAQEDVKNVASGADCTAERAEAQGRPGTGTCAPNRDMRPELDRLSRSKNQPYHNQPLGTSSVDKSDVGRKSGSVCGDKNRGGN